MKRVLRLSLALVAVSAAVLWALNTSLFSTRPEGRPLLIAHRGLGQTYWREGLNNETCTANRIFPPEHPYLENTVAGFDAAFAAGADIVEFDVHSTTDGHFVVFHDWTIDCRTEGKGVTREKRLAELKMLDIGYGYTADGGKTFPLRGKGVGQMPTLDDVLAAFPAKRFLINIKSNDPNEGTRLATALKARPREQHDLIQVYGGGAAMRSFSAILPDTLVLGTDAAATCLIRYGLLGWSGHVPEACRRTLFMMPLNFRSFVWGFPNRLAERMRRHGTMVVSLGDFEGRRASTGVDDTDALARIPDAFDGAIWTNRIDRIGPAAARWPAAKDAGARTVLRSDPSR